MKTGKYMVKKGGLRTKTVVITGAASGIGKAAALEFARRHYHVVATARSDAGLQELIPECVSLGAEILAQPADVSDSSSVESLARTAVDRFGGIDVWVNNAAVSLFGRFEEVPLELIRRVIDTNLFGYINGARAVIPHFRKQGTGTLINVSSVVGKLGQPYTGAYTISKFAINGLSATLRMELRDTPGVHVCTVLPASIDTPIFQTAANFSGRAIKPMEPVYRAEKVANTIVRLATRPRREAFVGTSGRMGFFASLIAPSLTEKVMTGRVLKHHFQQREAPASNGNLFEPDNRLTSISGGWIVPEERTGFMKRALAGSGALALGAGTLALLSRRYL